MRNDVGRSRCRAGFRAPIGEMLLPVVETLQFGRCTDSYERCGQRSVEGGVVLRLGSAAVTEPIHRTLESKFDNLEFQVLLPRWVASTQG